MKFCDGLMLKEENSSKHINIISHYDDSTLLDKSGKLIKIIKLGGLNFFTKSEEELDNYKNKRNNLLKSFSSDLAFYFWEIRRRNTSYPNGEFKDKFANILNEKYKKRINQSKMYCNELYLAIITKQPSGVINKGLNFIKELSHAFDKEAKHDYLIERHQELEKATKRILSSLIDYNCELLVAYEKNKTTYSPQLELLSTLINFDNLSVPLTSQNIGILLPKKRLFFNRRAGIVEMRSADSSKKFAAILSIKGYQPISYQGILQNISQLSMEYVITQSFRPYDKQIAKNKLRDQQKEMLQTKEESISQTEQIEEVFDDTASGEVGYGAHHLSIVCYANSNTELDNNVALIIAKFSEIDITCIREDIASECIFWSQLPGNFGYVLRAVDISTKNMAAFASLHNYPIGKSKNNHWGNAVTVLETFAGSPYYFNFHYKDIGNFQIYGATGSGKTVLCGFLILQAMKFGCQYIIGDKDRGLEIMVKAVGGIYEVIKPGISTGFNPCHLVDTPENRKFLYTLFKKMLTANGENLTEEEMVVITSAINGMYRLNKKERQLCHIASFFGAKRKSSLRMRFDAWHSDGPNAWLFDNSQDNLSFNTHLFGFGIDHILTDEQCKSPFFMYFTYCAKKALEGKRGFFFCDEASKVLSDCDFRDLFDDWSRTNRKKDNILGIATQVAGDANTSGINKSLNESAFCKFFFPNSSAKKEIYMDELGLSYREYCLVKTLPDDERFFLLIYGTGANRESIVARLNLTGMADEISIISAREKTLTLFDKAVEELGNDPDKWIPYFHKIRKSCEV